MRILLCLVVFGILNNSLAQVQTFPKGLKKLSEKKVAKLQPDIKTLPAFGPDGKLWSTAMATHPDTHLIYKAEFYATKKGEVVAVKFREMTDNEKVFAQFELDAKRIEQMVGTQAESFEATDMKGNPINLSDYKGSVVALNFWYIGCKPCVQEIPELNEIVEAYHEKPVKFVAIALDKADKLEQFLQDRPFTYDIIAEGRPVSKKYQVSLYPTHIIIDQEGKVVYAKAGYGSMTSTLIKKTLDDLLGD